MPETTTKQTLLYTLVDDMVHTGNLFFQEDDVPSEDNMEDDAQ